jgi:hypothetical protein
MEFPFAGVRMLARLLRREGYELRAQLEIAYIQAVAASCRKEHLQRVSGVWALGLVLGELERSWNPRLGVHFSPQKKGDSYPA